MLRSRENLGLLLGFIGVVVFGGTLPVTRVAVAWLDPWFITAARAALAGAAALAILLATRRALPPRATWRDIGIVALMLVLGFPALSALAMVTVPAAHGAVVLGVLPLATAGTAALIAGERPGPGFWILGLVGAALVIAFTLRQSGGSFSAGDLLLIASIATASLGYTVSGRLARIMPGWEVISWACAISLPVAALATWWLWPADTAAVPAPAWLAVGYVGLFPQYFGFFAWNAGLAMGGIARVSQVQLLQTFVTVALAALINRERIDGETIVFAVAVVATVMIGRRMPVLRS
jgi:drug/metabolite transporter (DMT)-like permease